MLHVTLLPMLYFTLLLSEVRYYAVPNMAVVCSFSISCFRCMLLRYFFNYVEMILFAVIITGITFDFTFHMRSISVVNSLQSRIVSASFLIVFLSPRTVTYEVCSKSIRIGIVVVVHWVGCVCNQSWHVRTCRNNSWHKLQVAAFAQLAAVGRGSNTCVFVIAIFTMCESIE